MLLNPGLRRFATITIQVSPNLYIVAGPNGVGKTTFAREFLPNYADCRNFVNADLIAAGLSPFAPEAAGVRAGRLVLEEIERLAKQRADFGFESTLSGRSYLNLIRDLKRREYQVHIFFLFVYGVEVSISRIKDRVIKGGHNVPEADVRRRFDRSIRNFFLEYAALADSWSLFDNSDVPPSRIAFKKGDELQIIKADTYNRLVTLYAKR